MAYHTLVNSIVLCTARYKSFVYQALYTKFGTTRFCILPDGSYMFLIPKDKIRIYTEAIDAHHHF